MKPKLALMVFHPHKVAKITYKHYITDKNMTFLEEIIYIIFSIFSFLQLNVYDEN